MDVNSLSPLVLAYIGDAVFELYVRRRLIEQGFVNVNDLHREAVKIVKATAQAETLRRISDRLTEEERDLVRRGRNAKGGSGPKGTDIQDYRHSTGFEAMLGHLHLMGRTERLDEVLQLAFSGGAAQPDEE